MGQFSRLISLVLVLGAFAFGGPLPENYESWNAARKVEYLYEQVEATRYETLPPQRLTCKHIIGLKALLNLKSSFKHNQDVMPKGRTKVLHPYGSVGVVQLNFKSSTYTGMFAAGKITAIARLSLAFPPSIAGVIPGMAIKIPISGGVSANMFAMPSVDGQGTNQNFFAFPFSNVIGEPGKLSTKILGRWFMTLVSTPNELSLAHLASFTPAGPITGKIVAPKQIIFVPTSRVGYSEDSPNDFREELAALEPDRVLFDVFVVSADGRKEEIGEVVLVSKFLSSKFGDEELFFQHRHAEVP